MSGAGPINTMGGRVSKFDIRQIVKDHYRTLYVNGASDRSYRLDILATLAVPALVALLLVVLGVRIYDLGDALAAVAVLAGFLFAILIVLLETAVETSGRTEEHGVTRRTNRRVLVLREVTANVAYSVIVSIGAVVLIGAARLTGRPSPPLEAPSPLSAWYCTLLFATLLHLLVTLVMVLKRVYSVTHRELDYAAVDEVSRP